MHRLTLGMLTRFSAFLHSTLTAAQTHSLVGGTATLNGRLRLEAVNGFELVDTGTWIVAQVAQEVQGNALDRTRCELTPVNPFLFP